MSNFLTYRAENFERKKIDYEANDDHINNKVKMRRRDAGNYVDKHCTIT
jgi:hypothetical protein